MARLTAVALLTLLLAALAPVGRAAAACDPDDRPLPERIEEARHVWKGKVTGTQDGGRVAIVEIQEVWKGEAAEERVRILQDGAEPTSNDRTWVADGTYLIFPRLEEDGEWHDSACSPTTEWSAELAELRPAGAGTAETGGEEEEPDSAPRSIVLLAIFAGALGLAGVAFRRRTS